MSFSAVCVASSDSALASDCSLPSLVSKLPRLSAGSEQFELDLNLRHVGMRRVRLRVASPPCGSRAVSRRIGMFAPTPSTARPVGGKT